MEKAIYNWYKKISPIDKRLEFQQVHEYPLSGTPPVMTHIFRNDKQETIIACKGAPEGILRQSTLTEAEQDEIGLQVKQYAQQGFRVLGVGKATWG